MNITYALPDTSLWGGIEVFLAQASRLQKRGHKVRVITAGSKPDWFKIDFELISVPKLTPRVIPQDSELIIGTSYLTAVVAHDTGFNIPIHYCRGYEYLGASDLQTKNHIDFVYSLHTVKVVNNSFLKKILEEKYHHPTYMIHNAIDLSLFHPGNRATFPKKRVLIAGPTEVDLKDIKTALKAAKILKKKLGDTVEIIRVSQFPISQEEQSLEVVDEYYNPSSREEMAKIYSSCDVLMASSKGKEEGFDLSPIEAMACGTPVVLTDISAYRSYDEVTDYALFVPPQDPETMAQAVIHLLEDKDLYIRLQKRGLEVAKKYDWDIVENEVETVFSEIKANHWEEFKLRNERMFPGKSDPLTEAMHFQRYRFASQFVKDKVVLDAGCGAGYGSWIMATEGGAREVIGIDYAKEIIEYDLEKYQKDNLTFETMNVLDLGFEDNKFDVVVNFEVFEHIDDPDALLKELSRVLKPDGILLLSTPNKAVYSPDKEPDYPFHVREYSYQEFRSILAKYFHNFKFIGQYLSSGKLELRTDNSVLIEKALAFIAIAQNPLKRKELNLSEGKSLTYYPYSSPEIQALIPSSAKKILDIGCGAGELGKALKERQDCEVTGVEIVPEVADKARENLDKVIVGDIEEIIDDLPENYYDVVIFADVLEHLKNPWKILSQIKTRINAQGIVIISIPNVRHWSVIKDLLEGRWDYQEARILGKTHLRFFTKQTILEMLDKAGFKVTNLQEIVVGEGVPLNLRDVLKDLGMEVSTLEEEGRIYQYLLVAQPKEVTPKTLSLTSIIILTRNNLEYTKMCLESIRRYTPELHEIIVVDNGSTDGTIEYLEAQEDVKLIKNGLNLGFALGNNLGLREARGEYIVILNNDTVVTEGWLTRLISSAQSNPQVGIVGPRSNYVVGPQMVSNVPYGGDMNAMQEFSRQWSLENSGRYEEALRVIGFCMLVKREVIEKIGGFDPYYEAGNFEDDDFCIRAQRAGFKIRIAHDVFIHHFGSKTFQSEKIDYRQVMLTNWERFKSKWGLPRELPIERGYPIYQLIQGGFDQDKHFVPLSIEPLSLEELRSQTYLSEFNTLTLRWFLSNFKPQDDVTLVIYHPEEKAEEEVAKAIQELGYDIDKTPDILLYSHPLPENKIPSLVAIVDKVLVDSGSSPFLIWAKYLNKEVIEIETALHEP